MRVSVGLLVLFLNITCSFGLHITDTNSISGQLPPYLETYTSDLWSGHSLDSSINGFSLGGAGSVAQYPGFNSQLRSIYNGAIPNSPRFLGRDASRSFNDASHFNGGSFSSSFGGPQSSGFFTPGVSGNSPVDLSGQVPPFPSHMTSLGLPAGDNIFSNSLPETFTNSGILGSSVGAELGANTFQDRFQGFTAVSQIPNTFSGAGVNSGFRSGNLRSAIDDITSALVRGFGSSGASSGPGLGGGMNIGLDLMAAPNAPLDSVLRGLSMP